MQRTASRLSTWMDQLGIARMSEAVLRLHYRWIRGALWASEPTGELTTLARSLRCQDRAWFDPAQDEHGLRRGYREETNLYRHGTTGRRLSHEDSFVNWIGLEWKG